MNKSLFFILGLLFLFLESRSLKILSVVNQFPCVSQQFILEQIKEFINRGHSIEIHSFKQGDNAVIQPDILLYHLDSFTTYGKLLPSLNSFDIIAVQFGNLAKTVIEQAEKQKFQGKIVVFFRGHDLSKVLQKNPDYYTNLFSKIDLCLPVCDFFKERLITLGCNSEKIVVSYSGLNLDVFPLKKMVYSSKKIFKIITVARLVEKKGIEYALRAISVLKKSYPNIQYYIFGDEIGNSGEKSRLKKLAVDLKINNQIHFCGWKPHSQIIQNLLLMDLMILPSIRDKDGDEEGIPNAVKEAMAVGLPVITTQRVGSELVHDGISGFLVEEKNYEQLALKIAFLIKNKKEAYSFGQKARQVIEQKFDIKKTIAALEQVFYSLLNIR